MTCTKCGALIPDKCIACQDCLEWHARRSVMPDVLSHRYKLKTIRYGGRAAHLKWICDDKAWCTCPVSKAAHSFALDMRDLDKICADCRVIFERLKKEFRTEVA